MPAGVQVGFIQAESSGRAVEECLPRQWCELPEHVVVNIIDSGPAGIRNLWASATDINENLKWSARRQMTYSNSK